MLTAAATTVLLWAASLAAALLSCAVSIARLIDRRRQSHVPSAVSCVCGANLATQALGLEVYAARPAPLMAGREPCCGEESSELVAHFSDVAHKMKTGDGLKFSGRTPWGYIIRGSDYSDASHYGKVRKDAEGLLWVVDSCEHVGVGKRLLAEDVANWPGQWYWAPIRHEFSGDYDRDAVGEFLDNAVASNVQYGWGGIVLQFLLHMPVVRGLVYASGIAGWKRFTDRPFCSMFGAQAMRAGQLDPVPGRAAQLITPQDMAQSMAFGEWVALVP